MIGIDIECLNNTKNIIWEILTDINGNWLCSISQEEIIAYPNHASGENIYFNDYITVNDFAHIIKKNDCLINFLKLEIYKSFDIKKNMKRIEKYQDFIDSECESLILVVDCYYLEIYSKNNNFLNNIISIADNHGCKVRPKEIDTDGRTGMNI